MKRRLLGRAACCLGMMLALSVLWTAGVWALAPSEGTVVTHSDTALGNTGMRVFQVSYVSSSAGGGLFTVSTLKDLTGWIVIVETDPGATTPTDDYDITLINSNGRDVMGGALANRDETNTEAVLPSISSTSTPVFNDGPLIITVTAIGNASTAEILIYYLP